ncbi:MAG: GcrA family cell cycle regulator [Alphaproteobacteria bacterium]
MDWTEDRISELTKLWNEGLSTAEIGKLLGISKNAVVGKAHRLRLASRPSPIRRMAIRPATPRVPRATRNLAMSALPQTAAMTPVRQAAAAPAAQLAPARPRVETPALQLSNQRCMWPVGHPGDGDFHFCGERALVGKPYCAGHCAVAYVKAKPKSGEAA